MRTVFGGSRAAAGAALAIALVLGGCGSGSAGGGPGPNPCDDDPAACDTACTTDLQCDPGFYCGSDDTCTADCGPSDACPDGQTCSDRGRCESGSGGTDAGPLADAGPEPDARDCPSVAVALEPVIPTVLLLLDQSGSMTENFGGVSRWNALEEALVDATSGVVALLESKVIFGAALYTSHNGGPSCPVMQEVAPAIDNYDAIRDLIEANGPDDDTPTAEAVTAAVAGFPAPDPESPSPRILVLATDGEPDNCEDPDAHTAATRTMSENAVADGFTAGIRTFILSVGSDISAAHLQRLANAGAGADLGTGTEPYYVANDAAQLVAAFDEIIRGVRTCIFNLDGTVSLSNADEGLVELNGTPLEHGTDWNMIDSDTLELLGAACDTLLATEDVVLTAEFPCGAVVE
jgi:hypothetical protein